MLKGLVGALLFLALIVVAAAMVAVGTGYVIVDDPGAAFEQVVNGDVSQPEFGVVEGRTGFGGVSTDSATIVVTYFVDNRGNAIGGMTDSIEYDIYWASSRDGNYDYLADGQMGRTRVPPGVRVTNSSTVTIRHSDSPEAVQALTAYATQDRIYLRFRGNASMNLGPLGFRVPFDEVVPAS